MDSVVAKEIEQLALLRYTLDHAKIRGNVSLAEQKLESEFGRRFEELSKTVLGGADALDAQILKIINDKQATRPLKPEDKPSPDRAYEMLEFHTPASIRVGKRDITGYRAKGNADTLLMFVHGFTGDPIATWDGFGEALLTDSEFAAADIVFYGYESVYESAIASAGLFVQFVDALCGVGPKPIGKLSHVGKVFARKNYDSVVFVCHSLGALIVRRAVLDNIIAVGDGRRLPSWEQKSRAVLFGPAHAGGRPIRLASALLHSRIPFAPLVHALTMYKVPVLEDLDPAKGTVKDLAADILRLQKSPGAVAHSIVIGNNDNVIERPRIVCDPDVANIPDEDHFSICKLRPDFCEPIRFVKGALQ